MNEEVKRCKICNKRLVGNRRMFCASCIRKIKDMSIKGVTTVVLATGAVFKIKSSMNGKKWYKYTKWMMITL